MVGRNMVKFLVDQDLASTIRVSDKLLPAMAYMSDEFTAAFASVEFKQGNLAREAGAAAAFSKDDGLPFDVVINCAALTKYGQSEEVYEENVKALTVTCANMAATTKVGIFIEVSTAQVYSGGKKASNEESKVKPWTLLATKKLDAERALAGIAGLHYVVVRPAIVYGPGDKQGLVPRLVIAAVYAKIKEPMKLLWTGKLRLNTVHVEDVVAALWHLANTKPTSGTVFNLADKSDTTQGSLSELLSPLFGIDSEYVGSVLSSFAKLNMTSVTDDVNEKHMEPWAAMCTEAGISNTPLTPYLDKELLYNNDTSVDGNAIEATGFAYKHPAVTEESLRTLLQSYIDRKLFPAGFMK